MRKNLIVFFGLTIVILAAIIVFMIWGLPYFLDTSIPAPTNNGFGSETVPAKITQILDQGTVTLGQTTQTYQDLSVIILSGPYKNMTATVSYGKNQIMPTGILYKSGDEMMVVVNSGPGNKIVVDYADAVRTRPVLIIVAIFVVALIGVARWKGVRALLALVFSFIVVIAYIIPHILHGEDPVRVSIIGSMIILAVTLYLTYGWNLKTHAAVASILIALILTGFLAWMFVKIALLTGNGSEEALYLIQVPGITVDLRGFAAGRDHSRCAGGA